MKYLIPLIFVFVLLDVSTVLGFQTGTISGSTVYSGWNATNTTANTSVRQSLFDQPAVNSSVTGMELCLGALCTPHPTVHNILTYTDGTQQTLFTAVQLIVVRSNVTYTEYNATSAILTLTDPTGTVRQTHTMTMTKTVLGLNEFTSTLDPTGLPMGNWMIEVTAQDTGGYRGSGSTTVQIGDVPRGISMQINLTLNTTGDTLFIPGRGRVSVGTTGDFTSPPHWFLSGESGGIVKGLVFSQMSPNVMNVTNTTRNYTLSMDMDIANSQAFLVFTQGSAETITNRMQLIQTGQFLRKVLPSFGYGLGLISTIAAVLEYDDIDIQSNLLLQRGQFELVFEGNGTSQQAAIVISKS